MNFLKSDGFQWDGAEVIGIVEANGDQTIINHDTTVNMLDMNKSNWNAEDLEAYQALKSKRKKCIVNGCTSRSIPIARSYHQLPVRSLEVWQKWVEGIRWSKNDPKWEPATDQPLVCSRHFPETDFVSYQGSSRSRLNHNAVPILYLDPPIGTVMNAAFNDDERELPSLLSFAKFKAAHQARASGASASAASATANSIASLSNPSSLPLRAYSDEKTYNKMLQRQQKEMLEVTPEFNFEEPAEYDPDAEYEEPEIENFYPEEMNIDNYENENNDEENVDEYGDEFQVENSTLLYGDTEMTPQEEDIEEEEETPIINTSNRLPSFSNSNFKIVQHNQTPSIPRSRTSLPSSTSPVQSPVIKKQSPTSSSGNNGGIIKTYAIKRPATSNGSKSPPTTKRIVMKVPGRPLANGEAPKPNGSAPTKHKIGMSKCRLIVDSIEQELEVQLKAIKMKIAQEMGVPFQVVHGVWQIKEQIKHKK